MKKFLTVIVFILTLGVIFSAPFLTRKSGEKSGDSTVILTLWHADSFEGGTGSRYTFLRKIAESFSKRYNGV
ncbi:MAG: hypothetical protein J6V66_01100, partial [Clostridia bacterium]|nr:hypothetical protein [Clostridia bacterium]